MKTYLLLTLLTIFSIQSHARGPAIEPGQGISIDQYDHSKNKNDPGFNWKQTNKGREATSSTTSPKNYRRKVSDTNNGSMITNILITCLVIVLPTLLWFALRKAGESSEAPSSTVVSLDQYRKDPDPTNHDDHDDSLPKAS